MIPVSSRQMGFFRLHTYPRADSFRACANTLRLTNITATLSPGARSALGVWSAERFGRLPDRLLSWARPGAPGHPRSGACFGTLVLTVRTAGFNGKHDLLRFRESLTRRENFASSRCQMKKKKRFPVAALVLSGLPLLIRHVLATPPPQKWLKFLDAPSCWQQRAWHPRRTRLYRYALRVAAESSHFLFGFQHRCVVASARFSLNSGLAGPGLGPALVASILSRDSLCRQRRRAVLNHVSRSGSNCDIFSIGRSSNSYRERREMTMRRRSRNASAFLGVCTRLWFASFSRVIPSSRLARIHTCRHCRSSPDAQDIFTSCRLHMR